MIKSHDQFKSYSGRKVADLKTIAVIFGTNTVVVGTNTVVFGTNTVVF